VNRPHWVLTLSLGLVATPLGAFAPAASPGKLDVLHFHSRILDADRVVRVWRPDNARRRDRYSVLYLNDGQNLFRGGDPDSGGGGWHADETAERLEDARTIRPLIVVGIDNAGDESRGVDYLPPTADRYLQFVIDELMPFINRKYPTLTGPAHTGFGGSSYGAACAFYAALSHPGVFGRLLLESPSVGAGNGVMMQQAETTTNWPERIVIGVGTGEGRGGRGGGNGVQALADILTHAGLGSARLKVVVQEGGRHNEASWASRFPDALAFLFHD
jgi:enterochelin esterase-like enzyme